MVRKKGIDRLKQLTVGIGMTMLSCMIFQWICRGPDSMMSMSQYQMHRQNQHVQFR